MQCTIPDNKPPYVDDPSRLVYSKPLTLPTLSNSTQINPIHHHIHHLHGPHINVQQNVVLPPPPHQHPGIPVNGIIGNLTNLQPIIKDNKFSEEVKRERPESRHHPTEIEESNLSNGDISENYSRVKV